MDAIVRANEIVECEEGNEGRAFPKVAPPNFHRYQILRRAALACRPAVVSVW